MTRLRLILSILILVLATAVVSAAPVAADPNPPPPTPKLTTISCVSASFCRAGGGTSGTVWAWDGYTWTKTFQVGNSHTGIYDLVCTSSAFCMLAYGPLGYDSEIEPQGTAFYRGGKWTVLPRAQYGNPLLSYALSCHYTGFCIQLLTGSPYDNDGNYSIGYRTWNGTIWSAVKFSPAFGTAADGDAPNAVDCSSSRDCRTVDYFGRVVAWNGTTWRVETKLKRGLADIDCPTSTFCAVVGGDGSAYVRRDGKWRTGERLSSFPLTSVSCATDSFCEATDTTGSTRVWTGRSWTVGNRIGIYAPTPLVALDVSCPKFYSCHAVTADGGIYRRGSVDLWKFKFQVR